MMPTDLTVEMIKFLMQVGVWAKDELSQIWKVKRTEASEPAIELSDAGKATPELTALLQANQPSEEELKITRETFETLKIEIARLKRDKLDYEIQNRSLPNAPALRRNLEQADKDIAKYTAQIKDALNRLGIVIEDS